MDLHLIPNAGPTDAERAAIDAVLGPPDTSWEGAAARGAAELHLARGGREARGRRHLLLPALHAAQDRTGYITPGALNYICRRLTVPPAEAYGVASFYALLATEPRPPAAAHVCDDLACRVNGAEALCRALQESLGPAGEPVMDGAATWLRSPCLGLCEQAPAAFIQRAGEEPLEYGLGFATAALIVEALRDRPAMNGPSTRLREHRAGATKPASPGSPPTLGLHLSHQGGERAAAAHLDGTPAAPQTRSSARSGLRLLRRAGRVDPAGIDAYRAAGGYAALRAALAMGPERVIREVADSRLAGRGGAAFPTGRKWESVARAPVRPHYLVCNADESEPGTFKDRVLLEEDPFAVVEAMTVAAYATGCAQGYLYVRGEYPLARARLQHAVESARGRGLLGAGIMGSEFSFDIELRRGAGAYICGEETALFNSIEGLRGEPRNKPPFPNEAGLFGKPTLVDNVETLVNVLDIVLEGGPAFAAAGTVGSAGPKLFSVSGCAARPGVYEVPFGTTLRELLALAGGVRDGRPLRAVLLGGAAGSFVGPADLDLPLTFEGARSAGTTIGSGAVLVFDDTVDLVDILLRIAAFFRDESCGQCVPCRAGTQRLEESVRRLAAGAPLGSLSAELTLIDDVARAMQDASICGLGQTAPGALQSAIARLGLFVDGERR